MCAAAVGVAGDCCRGDEGVWLHLQLLQGEAGRERFDALEGYALNKEGKQKGKRHEMTSFKVGSLTARNICHVYMLLVRGLCSQLN